MHQEAMRENKVLVIIIYPVLSERTFLGATRRRLLPSAEELSLDSVS